MTLTRLLEIKSDLLKWEDKTSLHLAERIWLECGAPTEPQRLCEVLEIILERCTGDGVGYPPILLKRKKQIERGAWSPEQKGGSPPGDPLPSEGDSNCPKCGGLGHVLIEGGRHAKMCECNKWMRSQRLQ